MYRNRKNAVLENVGVSTTFENTTEDNQYIDEVSSKIRAVQNLRDEGLLTNEEFVKIIHKILGIKEETQLAEATNKTVNKTSSKNTKSTTKTKKTTKGDK